MRTIDYYNQNARAFTADTISADFGSTRDRFTRLLPAGALILDFGCGPGRDAKAFLEQGYRVEAVDGSSALCRIAAEYTGIPVREMLFQDLDESGKYDGIWACASVLHLSRRELPDVLRRMERALREGGILYLSFKYGVFEGERNGRYFTDMTEASFDALAREADHLEIEEQWVSGDVRAERGHEKWLNIILRKR